MYAVKEYNEYGVFITATFFQTEEYKEAVVFCQNLKKEFPEWQIDVVEIEYDCQGELMETFIKKGGLK